MPILLPRNPRVDRVWASGTSSERRWVEVTLILGVLVYFFLAQMPPSLLSCPFLSITGHECPTCGTTRSLWNILHGNLSKAWHLNPVGYCVLVVLIRRICVLLFMDRRFT